MPANTTNTQRFSSPYSAPRVRHHPLTTPSLSSTADTEATEPAPLQADLLYLTDARQDEVEWLWQDRLATGTVAVLSGYPGCGKTWVALAIASALTNGQDPGNIESTQHKGSPCTVIYAAAHYLGSQLIRPRFLKLGGNPARLVLLRGSDSSTALSLYDTPILEDALERTGARLLILDPLHSYLASGTRHRAHEAALVFDNLAQLAEKYHCCILLVRHLRRRGPGAATIELSGAVRTEFLVGSSPDAPDFFGLVQTKSNLGPMAGSLGYVLDREDPLAFHWTGPSALTPEDLQTDRPKGAGLPQRRFAAEWLQRQLAKGPLSRGVVESAAQRDGLSIMTIRRAKLDIGIVSYKNSFDGSWYWELLEGYGAPEISLPEAAISTAQTRQ